MKHANSRRQSFLSSNGLLLRWGLSLALLVSLVLTSGCVSVELLVKVRGDGSGTLTQRTSVHPAFVKQATKMIGSFLGADGEDLDIFSQESLEKMALELGEGVTLVSREELSRKDAKGVLAVYAFEDIRKLRAGQGALGEGDEDGLTFELEPTGRRTRRLTARLGGDDPPELTEEATLEVDGEGLDDMLSAQLALFKPFLKGLKLSISMEVDGKILETNGLRTQGNQVTVLEIDVDQLLQDEASVRALLQDPPSSVAEARASLAGLDGVTVPPDNRLEVTFKSAKKKRKRK